MNRPPPDVVIAGAYRSGTTTLRHMLDTHPDLYFPRLAEPSFFGFDDGKPPRHLLMGEHDPFRRRRINHWHGYQELYRNVGSDQLACDCSPEYLRAPGSFSRLAQTRPDVRVIVTLRHPVSRLISDWQMCRRDGVEPLGLRDALAASDEREATGSFGGHYLATSRYSTQLPELFAEIPRSQILILIHEEWTLDQPAALASIADFLGIQPFAEVDGSTEDSPSRAHNRSGEPSNAAVAAIFRLRRRLAPHLGGRVPLVIQRQVDHWLQRGLQRSLSEADVAYVEELLAGEVRATERVCGQDIPQWETQPQHQEGSR